MHFYNKTDRNDINSNKDPTLAKLKFEEEVGAGVDNRK